MVEGRRYAWKAIAGVAYGKQFPTRSPSAVHRANDSRPSIRGPGAGECRMTGADHPGPVVHRSRRSGHGDQRSHNQSRLLAMVCNTGFQTTSRSPPRWLPSTRSRRSAAGSPLRTCGSRSSTGAYVGRRGGVCFHAQQPERIAEAVLRGRDRLDHRPRRQSRHQHRSGPGQRIRVPFMRRPRVTASDLPPDDKEGTTMSLPLPQLRHADSRREPVLLHLRRRDPRRGAASVRSPRARSGSGCVNDERRCGRRCRRWRTGRP
jgi:hypothetical protein